MAAPKPKPGDPIADLVESLLVELGEDPDRPGLKTTPDRVSRALRELTDGYGVKPEDVIADAARSSEAGGIAHVVIGCPQKVAGVPLLDELGHRTRRRERDVVGVCLDGQQHFALVGRPFGRAFDDDFARRLLGPRLLKGCLQERCTGQRRRDHVTTVREVIVSLHWSASLVLG